MLHLFKKSDRSFKMDSKYTNQLLTACKRYSPAAGATQGYDRLHANRYATFNQYNEKIQRHLNKDDIYYNISNTNLKCLKVSF